MANDAQSYIEEAHNYLREAVTAIENGKDASAIDLIEDAMRALL